MQELVTPLSEPAHLHLQLRDSCMTRRDSTETWLPTFAAGTLSRPGKREQYLPAVLILGPIFLDYAYSHSRT